MALSLVNQAIQLDEFRSVGFTGGEPILRINLVEELGKVIHDAGLQWGLTTGGGWARSEHGIDRNVERLTSAGIHNITVSVDRAHLTGTDPRLVQYFVEQVVKAGVKVTVSCTSDEEVPVLPISVPVADNLRIEYHYVSPVGYASGKDKHRHQTFSLSHSKCPMPDGLTLSVWPDGTVYPCCSTYVVNKDQELAIGNVFVESLGNLLERALKDVYLCAIREIGFSGVICLTPTSGVWKKLLKEPLLDQCHLCSKISRSPGALDELRSQLSQHVAARIT